MHEKSQAQADTRHAALTHELTHTQNQLRTTQQTTEAKEVQISKLEIVSFDLSNACAELEREKNDARKQVEALRERVLTQNELVATLHTLTAPPAEQ
jgi:hypothetical protein